MARAVIAGLQPNMYDLMHRGGWTFEEKSGAVTFYYTPEGRAAAQANLVRACCGCMC